MAPAQSAQILLVARPDPQGPTRRTLRDAGYRVVSANSAPAAIRTADRAQPGVIVADPRALTAAGRDELTSFADEHHIPLILGWSDHKSLVAEVEQALNGHEPLVEEPQQLVAGSLRVDLAARVAVLGETQLGLTAREFDLLAHFARHPGWVYSRRELLEQVWGYEYGDPQVVTVHIANLRKKVEAASPGCKLIETVQGVGYRLVSPPATQPSPATAAASQPPSKRHNRTRIIVASAAAAVVILASLGVGLWLGLWGEDEATSVPGAGWVDENAVLSFVNWGPETVTEVDEQGDVFWQASWFVHAKMSDNPGNPFGTEVMDWSVTLPPPTAPPLGRNETADLVYAGFHTVQGASVATVIFRFDTKDWEHPGPPNEPYPPFVYHIFVLTDNPGSTPDHVDAYAQPLEPDPEGPWGFQFMDIDTTTGVEIVTFTGATSTTQE